MRIRVRVGYGILLATYLAVELSIILGCPSFRKNWQIFPDPGSESMSSNCIPHPAQRSRT